MGSLRYSRGFRAAIAALAACAAITASPALARAEHTWSQFQLKASNGFVIGVERDGPFFSLIASNGPTGAIYSTLTKAIGKAEPTAVKVDLGKLGEIDVQFEALKPPKQVPNQPNGCTKTETEGAFVGSIRFRGERDYTAVDSTRATGVLKETKGDCDTFDRRARARNRARGGPPSAGLTATKRVGDRAISFSCNRGEGLIFAADNPKKHPQRRYFEAAIGEKYQRFNIIRLALSASDNRSTFAFDDPLTAATTSPPPPFTGSATFKRRPGRKPSWTGSLSVSFPGAPHTRLAGPGFTASLEYASGRARS